MGSNYAWVITEDKLETDPKEDAVGICGPRDVPDGLLERVKGGEGHIFRLYDDDGIYYYKGRLLTTGDMGDEEHCYAPLADFGTAYAGAVTVKWHGHPEWDCG